ncbi:MAG: hypothetical protein K2M73_02940 [Lachnospiraceae bacterium]|nr:hypothetical protein [Lachnospiraceae bacterium]
MNSNPKILVFQLKELIYTVIFVILAVLLIILLVRMFSTEEGSSVNAIPTSYENTIEYITK